jgi:hypothetical protein
MLDTGSAFVFDFAPLREVVNFALQGRICLLFTPCRKILLN